MAKRHEPRHKVSRRFGIDIYGTGGDALQRKLAVPPGGTRRARRRRSTFGVQLLEKQKAKALYGVLEGQFRRYVKEAARQPGDTSENLLRLLERRLDNVVYRLGFARTRPMARQLVNHGHVRVGGRRVNIPSYLVRPGETLVLDETAARMPTVAEELAAGRRVPDWLAREATTGRVLRLPDRTEADPRLDAETIIGFYTR
ncbi:MAG TPA: 30S ribosomal protein S4 [Ktedonobacterales bacterium]|nr:30S ribosomal protein S4 [Ktedonobacterales bacterium]